VQSSIIIHPAKSLLGNVSNDSSMTVTQAETRNKQFGDKVFWIFQRKSTIY